MSLCPTVRRSFSDDCGPGTFHTLGDLPKRKTDILSRKFPVFHLAHDDDDDDHSSVDEHSSHPHSIPPPAVPFPRSPSPQSFQSSSSGSNSRPISPRPQLSRGASAPILLSNGKPLKSSLKSSSSSHAMLIPPHTHHMHLRARSEPSSPVNPKNVHFPEKDYALATVRIFNRSARPAALSNPANGNGDETETEGEDTPPTRFPFPPHSPIFNYEIDPIQSSLVPSEFSPPANVLLESLNLSRSSPLTTLAAKPLLTGSILVRNLAFEKHVAIRFTLDDWQTVSEVGAHYVESLSDLPSRILPSPSTSISEDTNPQRGRGWDRFTFIVRLEDYAHSLSTRTLWLAPRYRVSSIYPEPGSARYGPGGEWWDNNGGKNYRVGFRPTVMAPISSRTRPRRETVSAPITSPRSRPQPATTCKEHALGLMIPSFPNNKEVQSLNESDRRSMPLRAGKLDLCNYAPPTFHATSSILSPLRGTSSSITNSEFPSSTAMRPPSDDDPASPASSTLSTPSVSPTMAPRVIISGQPATFIQPHGSSQKEEGAITSSRPGHIADWDWSAPNKPWVEELPHQNADFVPVPEVHEGLPDIPSSLGRKALADSHSLYDTFVTKWCFAQGPSPNHHGYDHGGIMA